MKKLLIAGMMVAVSAASFAQDLTKEMKGKSYDEAAQIVKNGVSALPAEMKAKAYNQLVEIAFPEATKTFLAFQTGQKGDFTPVYNAIDAAVKADPFDNEPNIKGKVAPKYHKKNIDRLKDMRVLLIVHGQDEMSADRNDEALKYFEAYVTSATSSLFNDVAGVADPNRGNVSRVVAYLYAQKEDYVTARKFGEIAMSDTASAAESEGIYIAILEKAMKTKQDTLEYIAKLADINAEKYFGRRVELMAQIGETALANKLIDDAIAANPNNKMAHAMKGMNAMNANNHEAAIEAFEKTVEIDPTFTQIWFNLGVSYYTQAAVLQEKYSDKQGKISREDDAKVVAMIEKAKTAYEKVRELDPNYETIPQWPRQLRMVYNQLGLKDKADEISKMLGE